MFHSAMKYCKRAERQACVYVDCRVKCDLELSTVFQDGMSGLHVEYYRESTGPHVVCHETLNETFRGVMFSFLRK